MEKYAKKCGKLSETKFLIEPLLFIFTFFSVIHLVEPFLYVCSRTGHLQFRPYRFYYWALNCLVRTFNTGIKFV